MTIITKPNTFTPGATILSSEHNSNFDTVYDDYNGNITNANIKSTAAIADTKLAQITTAGKIAGSALGAAWPIGSVFMSVVSTNPATLLGFGTWAIFGAGKVLVSLDTGDSDFDTSEETGGVKTVTLTGAQSGTSAHSHSTKFLTSSGGSSGSFTNADNTSGSNSATNLTTTGTVQNSSEANASSSHTNVQPYIVVHMFKRTA